MVFPWFSHRTICHVWPDTVCKGDAGAFALETEVPISVCLGIASVRELGRKHTGLVYNYKLVYNPI